VDLADRQVDALRLEEGAVEARVVDDDRSALSRGWSARGPAFDDLDRIVVAARRPTAAPRTPSA
jgi:hypothetical protein